MMEKLKIRMLPYQEAPDPRHIDVLDGFRALFVLLVGWYHIWQQGWLSPTFVISGRVISLDFLLRSGYLWVDGLILLSGFLLYLPYAQGKGVPSIREFYKRRLIRILPSYLLCILPLFVIALVKGEYPSPSDAWKDLLAHLTFTHNLFPFSAQQTPLNGALWTLAVEMQFYLLFPLLARAFRKKPLLTYACMAGAAFLFRGFAARQADTAMLVNQLPAFLDVYANGFLAASVFMSLRKKLFSGKLEGRLRLFFTAVFILCLCLLVSLCRDQAASNGYEAIRRGQMERRFPLSALLSVAMVSACFSLTAVRFALGNQVMGVMAAVSFQFYIWHQMLAVKLRAWHFPPSLSPTPWQDYEYAWQVKFTLCCFALALVWAALITYLFEKPLARHLRR